MNDIIEIKGSPGYVYRLMLGLDILFLLILFAALDRPISLTERTVIVSCVLVVAALANVLLVRRALKLRGVSLVLSLAGIEDRRTAFDVIPWTSITDVSVIRRKGAPFSVNLGLNAAYETKRFGHGRSGRTMAVTLKDLAAPETTVIEMIIARRNEAIAQLSDEDRAALPPARVDPTLPLIEGLSKRQPIFTYVLLGVLGLVSVLQFLDASGQIARMPNLTPGLLVREGGMLRGIHSQYWRFISATFLHQGVVHLVLNGIGLLFAGYLLERLIGWRWFAIVYFVSALCGSIADWLFLPANTVSVGASGGVLGLFAATLVLAIYYPAGALRTSMMVGAVRILIPTLIPKTGTDLAGHIGGAIGGLIVGGVIFSILKRASEVPRHSKTAGAIALACVLASVAALTMAYLNHR